MDMESGEKKKRAGWNTLATRLMVSFLLYVIAVTALFTVFPYTVVRDMLEAGLAERGEARLKIIHDPVSGYLSLGMSNSVQSYLEGFPKELPEVSYAAMVDDKGIFQGNSDPSLVGKPWGGNGADKPGAAGGRRRNTTYGGKPILEVSAPVLVGGKPAGTIVIGLNHREMDNILGKLLQRLVFIGLFVLAVSLVSTRPFTTRIISGLTRLGKMTKEISRGELRTKAPEEGFDEIRTLARYFNTMTENLRTVLQEIQQAGSKVGEFSSSILGVIQDQAASASQQAASVSEVTATMEELSRTSHQIAENAESVKNASAKTAE
ncbi:MAG: HAMP domain-containing protein, partial [Deltaproteobacteria bacterium]|nr:HAMP domain-containing protein [Deltaproteobacteria bacterium]